MANFLLEDYTPVCQSLCWRLGRTYWLSRGLEGFLDDRVPTTITNDGYLASKAADVLYANCREAEQRGTLGEQIVVLELGVGMAVFARLFLDRFANLSRSRGDDFYMRLSYVATDASARVVEQVAQAGTLHDHHDRVVLAVKDASAITEPSVELLDGTVQSLGPCRAVLCNYLLCVLPFDVVELSPKAKRLVARSVLVGTTDGPMPTESERTSIVADPSAHEQRLIDLLAAGVLRSETQLQQTNADDVPRWSDAADYVEQQRINGDVLLSSGALNVLCAAVENLRPDGFILFSDYGWLGGGLDEPTFARHQSFGAAPAMGLNFPLLDHVLTAQNYRVTIAPGDAASPIHSRLVARTELPQTVARFRRSFDGYAFDRYWGDVLAARRARRQGDIMGADQHYARAHAQCSVSWQVLCEWANLRTLDLDDPERGLELALQAASLNPTGSADVHNELGDARLKLGELELAHEHFIRARSINDRDPRVHLNLARTHCARWEVPEGLVSIGRGLALDRDGFFRPGLVNVQGQLLDRQRELHEALVSAPGHQ